MISELDGKLGQSAPDTIHLLVFIMEELFCCFIIFVVICLVLAWK